MRILRSLAPRAVVAACALVALLACSPDRGGASAGAGEHDDHGEHDDVGEHGAGAGRVELTAQQVAAAGIEVAAVGPGTVAEVLTLPGTIAPNADAVLHVTPRVAGQVRSVSKQLGETVRPGEVLCVIDSVELGDAVAGYLRDRELVRAAEETLERGRELFAQRLAALETVLAGAVAISERIHAREAELQEKAVSTIRPLLDADKALQIARLERDSELTELRAERDARLLELEVALRARRIDLTAAANRLRALGLSEDDLSGLDGSSPLLAGEHAIRAPGAGVVVSRHASAGEFVEAGAKLYIIEDLASVWFVASAFEEQLRAVRTGQPAAVSLDAFPDATLRGVVSFIDYHVDPTSRSLGVRVTLDNEQLASWPEDLPLRPGMFGRARLETASRQAALVMPEAALVHEDDGDDVFVQVAPGVFERRAVGVRHAADGLVEVVAGLAPGERVVVAGTFLLESAERQGELGGGHGH